jgi:hypothetical protein
MPFFGFQVQNVFKYKSKLQKEVSMSLWERKVKKPLLLTTRHQEFLKTVPKLYVNIITKAYDKTANKTKAIQAKCLECCGFYKNEVTNCTCEICPLWRYRPYQKKEKSPKVETSGGQ